MSHSCDIFSLGSSYLNVALTTVHRLYSPMTLQGAIHAYLRKTVGLF